MSDVAGAQSQNFPQIPKEILNRALDGLFCLETIAFASAAEVRKVLELGGDANLHQVTGDTPLARATAANRSDLVQLLLECGASPADGKISELPILTALAKNGSIETLFVYAFSCQPAIENPAFLGALVAKALFVKDPRFDPHEGAGLPYVLPVEQGRDLYDLKTILATIESKIDTTERPLKTKLPHFSTKGATLANSKEFFNYLQALSKINTIVKALDDQHLNGREAGLESVFISPLLVNFVHSCNEGWEALNAQLKEYSYENCRDVADFVKDVVRFLILPTLFESVEREKLGLLQPHNIDQFLPQVALVVASNLFERKDPLTVLKLSKIWHDRREVFTKCLRTFEDTGFEWRPILNPSVIKVGEPALAGYTIVNLTSAKELDQEAKALAHCVDTYVSLCTNGKNNHILSIRDPEGKSLTTIQLGVVKGIEDTDVNRNNPRYLFIKGSKSVLQVVQHSGHRNSSAPANAVKALSWLKAQLESGEIRINLIDYGDSRSTAEDTSINYFENHIGLRDSSYTVEEMNRRLAVFAGKDVAGPRLRSSRNSGLLPSGSFEKGFELFASENGFSVIAHAFAKPIVEKLTRDEGLREILHRRNADPLRQLNPDLERLMRRHAQDPDDLRDAI